MPLNANRLNNSTIVSVHDSSSLMFPSTCSLLIRVELQEGVAEGLFFFYWASLFLNWIIVVIFLSSALNQ